MEGGLERGRLFVTAECHQTRIGIGPSRELVRGMLVLSTREKKGFGTMNGRMNLRSMFIALVLALIAVSATSGLAAANPMASTALAAMQAETDSDGDGLTDRREAEFGTDPALVDTDADGISDGDEVDFLGTDPLNPLGALTVGVLTCPAGAAVPAGCDAVPNVSVELSAVGSEQLSSATTGFDGSATFVDLESATYEITQVVPGDAFAEVQVTCSAGTEGFPVTPDGPYSITLETSPGRNYSCTFSNIMEPVSSGDGLLSVEAFLCPQGYHDSNYFVDCTDPAVGVPVAISNADTGFQAEAESDANGAVSFTGLDAGTHTIELGVPGDFADFQVVCGAAAGGEAFDLADRNTNIVTYEFSEGFDAYCNWFVFPLDSGAPETVTSGTTPPAKPTATTLAEKPTATAAARVSPTPAGGAVSNLPDTGSGGLAIGNELWLVLLLAAFASGVAGCLTFAARMSRR